MEMGVFNIEDDRCLDVGIGKSWFFVINFISLC